jgi:hypothetical protein
MNWGTFLSSPDFGDPFTKGNLFTKCLFFCSEGRKKNLGALKA